MCERQLETEQNCIILTPTLLAITAFLLCSHGQLNRGPGGPASLVHVPQSSIFSPSGLIPNLSDLQLTDFLSSSGLYNCFTSTQYLPITGQRNMQLPPSLEWHVWSLPSGNNCRAVHRSLSSGASVCDCTVGFNPVPYCQPSLPTQSLPITDQRNMQLPPSLEWHVWPGRRSVYNRCHKTRCLQVCCHSRWWKCYVKWIAVDNPNVLLHVGSTCRSLTRQNPTSACGQ